MTYLPSAEPALLSLLATAIRTSLGMLYLGKRDTNKNVHEPKDIDKTLYLLDAAIKEALYCSSLDMSTLAFLSLSALVEQSQTLPRSIVCQSSWLLVVVEDVAVEFSGHGSPVDLLRLLLFRPLLLLLLLLLPCPPLVQVNTHSPLLQFELKPPGQLEGFKGVGSPPLALPVPNIQNINLNLPKRNGTIGVNLSLKSHFLLLHQPTLRSQAVRLHSLLHYSHPQAHPQCNTCIISSLIVGCCSPLTL